MLVLTVARRLILQPSQLSLCRLRIWNAQQVNRFDERQDIWDHCEGINFILFIQPSALLHNNKNIRRQDCVLLNRLRNGHSRLTHSCILSSSDLPTFEFGRVPLTIRHILFWVCQLAGYPWKIFQRSFLLQNHSKAFDNHSIIDFIKETHPHPSVLL